MDYSSVALVQTEPNAPKMVAVRVPDEVAPGDAVAFLKATACPGSEKWWPSGRPVIGVVKSVFKGELAEEVAEKMTTGFQIPAATAIWKRIGNTAPAGAMQERQGMAPAELAERVIDDLSRQIARGPVGAESV